MILFAKEVTTRGDSYGHSIDSDGKITFTATRTFIIKVDTSEDRSIDEVLAWLPQQGDSHPYIPQATVVSVKVDLEGADPHIYLATVEYGDNEKEDKDGKKEDDTNPEYPWNQRAEVVYQSDDSTKEVNQYAYAVWGYKDSQDNSLSTLYNEIPQDGPDKEFPFIPILIKPTNEQFKDLPEEAVPSFGLQISMAVKGYKNIKDRRQHDSSVLQALKQQCFTVNEQKLTIFGYEFNRFCGYLSEFSVTPKFHINRHRRAFAYYTVTIKILDKPTTWVRLVQNMSMNRLEEGEDPWETSLSLVHIKLQDADTGVIERIQSPVPIHPDTGAPLNISDDHRFIPGDRSMYVIPYLTKRPDDWDGLLYLNAINESRPLR